MIPLGAWGVGWRCGNFPMENLRLVRVRWILAVTIIGGILVPGLAWPNLLENGSFESGEFSGWKVFTTENGTVGQGGFPDVVVFDTNGDGEATKSVRFQVGQDQIKTAGDTRQGGGLYTQFVGKAGTLEISLDVACTFLSNNKRRNLDGGLFELLLDGKTLSRYAVGPIHKGATKRGTLRASSPITAGVHQIRIQITRPFASPAAPFQYIDNVVVSQNPHSPQ